LPDFRAAGERLNARGRKIRRERQRVAQSGGSFVATIEERKGLASSVDLPESFGGGATGSEGVRGRGGILRVPSCPLGGQARQTIVFLRAEFVEKRGALFGGDLDRAGKPPGESPVEEGVADEKHEDDGEKRDANGADDHLGFEAGAELFVAAFGPKTQEGPRDDQAEHDERCRDERGDGVESEDVAPVARFERSVKRAERENGGEKKSEDDAGQEEAGALRGGSGSHGRAILDRWLATGDWWVVEG
jgi:hypothetical protein